MKAEPLKGKTLDIYGTFREVVAHRKKLENLFDKEDVTFAVQWLKDEIMNNWEAYITKYDVLNLVDKAFVDVIDEENDFEDNYNKLKRTLKKLKKNL